MKSNIVIWYNINKLTYLHKTGQHFLYTALVVLHRGMHVDEASNTAVMKSCHLHDHCLLSKWKRAMCAETPLHAHT